ncbi:MAG: 30S ribosomal protein S20 [Anaerolineae bacterium]|nr:30S ribosomal protein S20 [Anaerolineae bacterium]
MAHHKSALKRIRSNERKRIANRIILVRSRTFVKKATATISGGDAQAAREATLAAIRELDKAVTKGVLHKNTAARKKSRLMKKLNALSR